MSQVQHQAGAEDMHYAIDDKWVGQRKEEIIEPDLPIVDPHHHLWDRPGGHRYLLPELLADIGSGHNVRATMFVECTSMYRSGLAAVTVSEGY